MDATQRAIRVLGAIDERHKLHADVPASLSPGSVQVFVLPIDPAHSDAGDSGHEFEVERTHRGEYRLRPQHTSANGGIVEWLLACPHKDFFVLVRSESTDTI